MSYTSSLRFLLLGMLFLGLCACKVTPKTVDGFNTNGMLAADFAELPQDLRYYSKGLPAGPLMSAEEQHLQANKALATFFSPWSQKGPKYDAKSAFWFVNSMDVSKGFLGQDIQFPTSTWDDIRLNMDMERYPSQAKPAIVVSNASLRAMPTPLHFYLNPHKAGEGYPFDYLQLSALWVGTPVMITHTSLDGRWVLAESALTVGWLPVEQVAFTDPVFNAWWQNKSFGAIVQDSVHFELPVGDNSSTLAMRSQMIAGADMTFAYKANSEPSSITAHIGTLLPLDGPTVEQADEEVRVLSSRHSLLVPVRLEDGSAAVQEMTVAWEEAKAYPILATANNIAVLGNQMMGQAYGWGGIDELRDCSAMAHDLLLPFGIWLPRNSSKQALVGEVILLDALSPAAKEKAILEKGVPFFSLVYLPGHIGLYVGEYGGKAVLFHNMWGVSLERTMDDGAKQYGRAVIGRAVVTTLRPGVELPFAASPDGFLEKIQKLTILPKAF